MTCTYREYTIHQLTSCKTERDSEGLCIPATGEEQIPFLRSGVLSERTLYREKGQYKMHIPGQSCTGEDIAAKHSVSGPLQGEVPTPKRRRFCPEHTMKATILTITRNLQTWSREYAIREGAGKRFSL